CCASKDTSRSHGGTLCENTSEKILRLGSEGQPNAESPRPRADRKREDAGDANHCNRQRDGGENPEHQRVQPVRREHLGAHICKSGSMLNRLIRGNVANNPCDRWDQRIGICGGVDEKTPAKYPTLIKR